MLTALIVIVFACLGLAFVEMMVLLYAEYREGRDPITPSR